VAFTSKAAERYSQKTGMALLSVEEHRISSRLNFRASAPLRRQIAYRFGGNAADKSARLHLIRVILF
jgi:hypothetical protein